MCHSLTVSLSQKCSCHFFCDWFKYHSHRKFVTRSHIHSDIKQFVFMKWGLQIYMCKFTWCSLIKYFSLFNLLVSWLGVTAPGRRRSRQPGERRRKLRRQRGSLQWGHWAGRPLLCVCLLRSRGQYFVPTLYLIPAADNTAFWLVSGGDCSLPIGRNSQHARPWVTEF